MMPFINSDVTLEIFKNLIETNELAVPILWSQPFHFLGSESDEESDSVPYDKILGVYLRFLNDHEREDLLAKGIDISLVTTQHQQNLYCVEDDLRRSDLNDDDNSIIHMGEPKFPYITYLRSLSYITLCSAVEIWCQDLADIMSRVNGEELVDNAEEILLRAILKLFYDRGAKLMSLNITINDFLDGRTINLRRLLVDEELKGFFAPIRSLEFNVMYTSINDFLSTLSETCHQLNHISVHTLWTRRCDAPVVKAFERSFNALISAQTSLTSFHLTECKGYTHVFFPALYSCVSTLRHLTFECVDFEHCQPWNMIADCRNIMFFTLAMDFARSLPIGWRASIVKQPTTIDDNNNGDGVVRRLTWSVTDDVFGGGGLRSWIFGGDV
ncbi:4331_t:CDS:2 [Acaulospora colombiana]|uniref:4331_t:CDS:1 n=1 Tax=Acaulospora colombiana TaxID=27376 RepID=A0ACA9K8R9_9GLOM|nr:4331_t:CDS:2 [Acaulospora colombiana]